MSTSPTPSEVSRAPSEVSRAPGDALAELLAGNRRFVTGTRIHPHQDADYRARIAVAQRPFAVVFGCSDSRLAAEIIFDRGLGDLFVVRTAGHVTGPEVLASIGFAITVLRTPLVVVLGHDSCGAVHAAHSAITTGATPDPQLAPIIDRIAPTISSARHRRITDPDAIAELHVQHTVELIGQTPAFTRASRDQHCAVVGMSYRLADGRVTLVTGGAPT
ncbi:MAG TPA: carbonic anhydrase [Micromonosporaceae bacterium]|nr:carbonic anhydrase [Micromonosporaceae bacterium]